MSPPLHQAIIKRAETQPGAVAVRMAAKSLTYSEMAAMSEAIARSLRGLGFGTGSIIGVCLPRTPELVAALLGVLRAGCAYLPIDPEIPPRRMATLVDDAMPGAVITTESLAQNVEWSCTTIRFDDLLDPASGGPLPVVSGSDLAYVIYTSGSTGRPKGVAVPHTNVVTLILAMLELVPAQPGDVFLSFTSPAFDISVFEFFGGLSAGMTVELADAAGPRLFDSALAQDGHDITHLQATPSLLAGLLLDQATRMGLSRVKNLLVGGEAFPRSLAEDLLELRPNMLLNCYGPTEATVWSTVATIDHPLGEITIGQALRGQVVVVLDPDGNKVGVGEVAELFIGGSGVAWGYLGQPGLTAERFMADPFSESPGARMYRTGDLGMWRPDGALVCLGRNDRQTKISGHRIEVDEVEHALLSLERVDRAAVIVVGDAGAYRLVAVVAGSGGRENGRRIRAALATLLPAAAVPAEVRFTAALPLTTSGKVDRRALGDSAVTGQEPPDNVRFELVVNGWKQHALWWESKLTPAGWHRIGVAGSATECVLEADRRWSDIRPLESPR